MTETMMDGIVLSLYGLGTVFAALVSFSVLVLIMQRLMGRTSYTDAGTGPGGDGTGPVREAQS